MHKFLFLPSFLLLFALANWTCKTDAPNPSTTTSEAVVPWLFLPVQLNVDGNSLVLEDFFLDPAKVDSIQSPSGLSATLSADKKTLDLKITGPISHLENIRFFTGSQHHDLLVKGPVKKPITFTLPDKGYTSVQMKGEMNAWNPQSANFSKNEDNWTFTFQLAPGNYQYMYLVDGKETMDPVSTNTIPNGIGGTNNLLEVAKPDPTMLPSLYSISADGDHLHIGYVNLPDRIFAYWNNQLLSPSLDEENNQFLVNIPPAANSMERSKIRIWAINGSGVSNDLLIPLSLGKVMTSPDQTDRRDVEAQIMYFTLIDRFNNGDPNNDAKVDHPELTEKTNYWGGDIAGITQKIKDGYLDQLNINSLWLSPITQNPEDAFQEFPEPNRWYSGYHGYWPTKSSIIDHRFGTKEDMQQLVETAHQNDMAVLLDYICNHVHQEHAIFQQHPEWATELDLPNGEKNIRIWDEQRLTTWFDTFLPSLDLANPDVIDVQSDSALYWIKEFGLDGFRHDATKHIPIAFWRTLTRKVKEDIVIPENRLVYQIGETYGSRDLIQSYIGTGLLDAQFDFNLYFESREAFARPQSSFKLAADALSQTFSYYGYHAPMGNITGNHDIPRFISLAGGDLKFGESDREAGFEREIGVGDPLGYNRLQMFAGFLFSVPGIPVIFYGDEIGMPGAGDPDNRRPMKFDNLNEQEQATFNVFKKLTELRSSEMALVYGDTEILSGDESSMVILRHYFGEWVVYAVNKSDKPQELVVYLPPHLNGTGATANFGNPLIPGGGELTLTLPPHSFDIITQ